jgi:hypothetical protein
MGKRRFVERRNWHFQRNWCSWINVVSRGNENPARRYVQCSGKLQELFPGRLGCTDKKGY